MSGTTRSLRGGSAIAICIPARNEAERLPRLFDGIERLIVPDDARLTVCLMLDGCADASATLAADYRVRSAHRICIAEADHTPANAGRARHRAMRFGMDAAGDGEAILLTTDADSVPATDWLVAMIAGLESADIVLGNVIRRAAAANPELDRIERYYTAMFASRRRIDPVAWEAPITHHHASGANMGMRARSYAALGGFTPLESGEDARLIDDAARAGLRVRRDADSRVYTSERRTGRAKGGLATMLQGLDQRGLDGVSVSHPADQMWQYHMHALARTAFTPRAFAELSHGLGLDADHLLGVARDCPNAEAFAMRVVPVPPGGMRHIPFAAAEAMLATMTASQPPAEAA